MSTQLQITPYPIRMEPKLRKALEDAAAANSRSLHAEIMHRLEGTLRKEDLVRSALNLPAAPLPDDWEESFRKIIREEAEKNDRSISAEIANALQSYFHALKQEEWENSPEYWEEINRLNQESPPEGLVGKELHKHIEEMKAQSLAELIAQKVTESLISNEDFLKALKKALSQK